MERTKLGLSKDKMYKALGEGERTSKKVASIRMSNGSTFKRKNANQYGTAEGGNDYTEKRSNRTDRFDLGGTADSSNTGANMGGTMGSSIMKKGGSTTKLKEIALPNSNLYLYGWGRDTNGNSAIKIGFPNRKGFTIQTNGVLPFSNSIKNTSLSDLSENDIEKIEKEVVNYVKNYGSSNQKSIIKAYKNGGKLIGKKKNLDLNKNGKLDSEDFKMIRGNKKANGGLADVPESFPNNDAVSYKTGGKVDAKDYYEQLAVYVQGVGSIYNGTSMKKAIDKANSYLKKNAKAEIVISDEKYGDTYDLNGNMTEEDEMAQGGSTKGFEYTIGGL